MSILHNRATTAPDEPTPEELLAAVELFLAHCREPAALEFGEHALPLLPGQFALEIRSGKLYIEIWTENRSVSRRIVDIEQSSTGVLDCIIHKFGDKPSRFSFLDLSRPQTAHRQLAGTRQSFGERFRTMLSRQFPGWDIRTLTVAQDLRRSFSSVYPRAHLSHKHQRVAALACAEPELESNLLAYALIWYDHIHASSLGNFTTSLALFLPRGCGNQTAQRLRWLNKDHIKFSIYLFNEHGSAGMVDLADLGNLQTEVAAHPGPPPSAEQVAGGPPERWLETLVRSSITAIDPFLRPHPVHSQVLTLAGTDRDLIDLLAATIDGRLCVIELKAAEDLQLPIQALDYWMRIYWHARRKELDHLFPEVSLQSLPPKLILLAPALQFHSTNATILKYFSSQVDVERVGINTEWRDELRVTMRLHGSSKPASHEI